MNYKYNEVEYAELIYKKGFQSPNHMPAELCLTAIYMRRVLGYKPKKLKEEFEKWCMLHISDYNRASYYKIVNKAVNQAVKKGSSLIKLDSISVYKNEIEFIQRCSIFDEQHMEYEHADLCQKLMFAFMVQLKINHAVSKMKNADESADGSMFFQGNQRKYNAMKKMAALPDKIKINEDLIYYLYLSGLVTPLHNGLICIDFMKDIYSLDNSENLPEIIIKDFERTGLYFDYYNKEKNIKLCEYCKRPYKKKSNNQKYCSECAAIVNVKKQKQRDLKKS